MQKFIFYLNLKNLKLLSNSGKYHNAGPQRKPHSTETDKLNVYTADKPRRCVDYIFTALDVFWKPYLYIFITFTKKGFHYHLPTIMKKNFFFFLFWYCTKLCIIKIYLCTKDFFLFVFVLLFFFFNLMGWRWVHGVNGGPEGPILPWLLPSLWKWREMPEVGTGNAEQSAGHSPTSMLRGHLLGLHKGRGAEAGLEEESTGWFPRCVRSGGGSSQRASYVCFQRKRWAYGGVCLNWTSLAKPRDAVIQEQVQASGLLPLAVVVTSVHLRESDLRSSDSESACTPGVPPVCFCHSWVQSVIWTSEANRSHMHRGLSPWGPSRGQRQWLLSALGWFQTH